MQIQNLSFKKNENKIKILILLPRQLGDVLLGTPILQVLNEQIPNSTVDWFAHPMAKQILENQPYLNEAHYYPVWSKKSKEFKNKFSFILFFSFLKFLWESICFAFRLRNKNYNIVIDAMNNPRSAIQSFISNAKIKISFKAHFSRNWIYHFLIDRTLLTHNYLGHSRLQLLSPLGIDLSKLKLNEIYPSLPFNEEHTQKIKSWMAALQQPDKPIILLSPTHRHQVRQWPKEHYVDLGSLLCKNHPVQIVWLWGPGEKFFVEELNKQLQSKLRELHLSENLSSLAPELTLKETAALASLSCGWVGNSNGLSHVVVSAKCKTLELHGPTYPPSWCHPNHARHQWLQRQTGCIQCSKNVCKQKTHECLDFLSCAEVYTKFAKLVFLF
ncbi:MAG: glycosyltransferase family 9 protein [Silvanigrellaceae bacterium]|nr:glycosyltransferase family 9 protein [Silvanigrellaceae bacterium]